MHTLLTYITAPHRGYALFFKPEALDATYKVIHSIDQEIVASYIVDVKFVKQHKKDYIIQLVKSNVVVSADVQNQALDLALKCGEVMYPLELLVNVSGHIIDVVNHSAIVSRWTKTSADLGKFFEGEAFGQYIYHTGYNLTDRERMLLWLQADLFLSSYFIPVNASLRDRLAIQFKSSYAVPLATEMITEQLPEMLDDHFFKVNITGASVTAPVTTLTGHYIVSRHTFEIQSASLIWQADRETQTYSNRIQIKKHITALQ